MSAPIVRVKQGALKGAVVNNVNGGQYYFFKGIPFAEPPIGELRFKDPQPPQSWTGIRDAQKEGGSCSQFEMFSSETRKIFGGDDCLYLNVATTSLSGKRPVMFYIHGGGFAAGSGDSSVQSPDHLINKDIVYVSTNYRLSCLGFLNMDHEDATGNQGLKDQVAALKWVQENIESFGGDPNDVTIFGISAGAASVHYLTLSPLTKGLFHKAILESGNVFCPWVHKCCDIEYCKKMGFELAKKLGKVTTDSMEAIEFLRSVSVESLLEATQTLGTDKDSFPMLGKLIFGPSIDSKSAYPLMPKHVEEVAVHGVDIPLLFGYSHDEGILFMADLRNDENFAEFDRKFDVMIGNMLKISDSAKITAVAKEIRKFYFGGEPITFEQRYGCVRFLGDINFIRATHQLADVQSKMKSPAYLYRFSFRPNYFALAKILKLDYEGTCHGDEICCVFHMPLFIGDKQVEGKDRLVLDRVTRMWTNFAKTGNPTPVIDDLITEKWLPLTSSTTNYLEIAEEIVPDVNPDQDSAEEWKRIVALLRST